MKKKIPTCLIMPRSSHKYFFQYADVPLMELVKFYAAFMFELTGIETIFMAILIKLLSFSCYETDKTNKI